MSLLAMTPPTKPADLDAFLGQLLPAEGNYWMIMCRRDGGMAHEAFDSVEKMAARIRALDANGIEVWHACASYEHAPGDKRPDGSGCWGRKKENVAYVSAFFLDIDVAADKPTKGYATLDAAEAALSSFADAFGIPPNYVVHSGGGLHVYWFLDVDVPRDEWEQIALRFKNATVFGGLRADPSRTADATSLLRPVETTNRKAAYGPLGRTVLGQWRRYGRVSLVDFERACDRLMAVAIVAGASIGKAPVHSGQLASGVLAHLAEPPKWFDSLDAETKSAVLRSLLAALPTAAVEDHMTWLRVGAALAGASELASADKFQLWADWSQSTEAGRSSWNAVSEPEQKRRWDSLTRSGVGSLIYMAKQAGWAPESLRDCPPGNAAYAEVCNVHNDSDERWSTATAQAYMQANVVFVEGENLYLHKGRPVTKEALDTSLARHMPIDPKVTASGLLKGGAGLVVDYMGYKPGATAVYIDCGRRMANTWKDNGLKPVRPTREDAQTFTDFFSHLGNRNDESKVGVKRIVTKLAWLYNNPGGRISHATLLVGRNEGCGKTTLTFDIPRALFGGSNVRAVEANELSSDFNGYALGSRILVFSELWLGNRKDAQAQANSLKPLITDARVSVVKKGRDGIDVENCTTIFANSNNADAAIFDSRDRRYEVVATDAGGMSAELAARVHALIRDRPAALLWLVLKYGKDASFFDPFAAPPMNRAKINMLQAGRAVWAERIRDGIESREWPFNSDAVAVSDVVRLLKTETERMPSEKAIRDELLGCVHGAYSVQAQRRQGVITQQKRVIVLRNMEEWRVRGPSALYDHYEAHVILRKGNHVA